MRITIAALFWALAILGVALAASLDVIPDATAGTMLVVLPILAAVSLGQHKRKAGCGACP